MFCICTGNGVATAGLRELLLSSACTASGAFLLPDCPPASRLGVHKALGGDADRTADPDRAEGHPTAHATVISNKTGSGGGGWRGLPLLGIGRLVESKCFPLHPLFFTGFSFTSLSRFVLKKKKNYNF